MKTFHNCKPYKKEHRALSKFHFLFQKKAQRQWINFKIRSAANDNQKVKK